MRAGAWGGAAPRGALDRGAQRKSGKRAQADPAADQSPRPPKPRVAGIPRSPVRMGGARPTTPPQPGFLLVGYSPRCPTFSVALPLSHRPSMIEWWNMRNRAFRPCSNRQPWCDPCGPSLQRLEGWAPVQPLVANPPMASSYGQPSPCFGRATVTIERQSGGENCPLVSREAGEAPRFEAPGPRAARFAALVA